MPAQFDGEDIEAPPPGSHGMGVDRVIDGAFAVARSALLRPAHCSRGGRSCLSFLNLETSAKGQNAVVAFHFLDGCARGEALVAVGEPCGNGGCDGPLDRLEDEALPDRGERIDEDSPF